MEQRVAINNAVSNFGDIVCNNDIVTHGTLALLLRQ